eukprot:CAMPEP_0185538010 /NCGR_PEP_ID=MMETSP1366-20130426/110730_1 /TAXON_ID=38817 /ORGANISM="Gephyrocapsa oceanica, Strain RCC1303" /LENGTH=355 /DNA_ID=CAMNT_0028149729 /DNA_START=33 /DNA_END=1098 /DNA_ORIENTATION=-
MTASVPAEAAKAATALVRRAAELEAEEAAADAAEVAAAAAAAAAAASSTTAAGRSMTERQQTLRVHFVQPLPTMITCGGWYTVAVRLSNEMGLFDAATFHDAAVGSVRLSAVAIGAGGANSRSTSIAPRLALRVRQAAEPLRAEPLPPFGAVSTPSTAAGACMVSPAGCLPVLRLHRGRAVAEVRVDERRRLCEEGGEAEPLLVALRADLLPEAEEEGLEDEEGLAAVGLAAVGALSLPVPLKPQVLLGAREGDGKGGAAVTADAVDAEEAEEAATREAMLPFVRVDEEQPVHEQVQGFRLLLPPAGSTSALPLVLAESAGGICGRVWDSGVVLTRWLTQDRLAVGTGGAGGGAG